MRSLRQPQHAPARIVLLYASFAALWIFASDALLGFFINDPAQITALSTIKGCAFVGVTAAMLFLLISRFSNRILDREALLAKQEAQYRRLFADSPLPMWVYDAETLRFLAVNDAAVLHYGFSREEILSMSLKDIRPPEEIERLMRYLSDRETEEKRSHTWRHLKKDGTRIWVKTTSHALPFNGTPARLVVADDITEKLESDRRFARMAALYACLSQANQAIVRINDRDTLFNEICEAAVRHAGFLGAEIRLKPRNGARPYTVAWAGICGEIGSKIGEHEVNVWHSTLDNLALEPCDVINDCAHAIDSGTWHTIASRVGIRSVAAYPLREKGRTIAGLYVYSGETDCFDTQMRDLLNELAYDVSFALDNALREEEKHQANQRLSESEERLRLAIAAANQGLYDIDIPSGHITVNNEYAQMLGYEPEYFEETLDTWFARLHPDDRNLALSHFRAYLAGEQAAYHVEYRMRTRDHTWKWLQSSGRIFAWHADGKPLRMLGTHTDITASKRLEAELRTRENNLRCAEQIAHVGYWERDLATGQLTCSDETYFIFGLPQNEGLYSARRLLDLIHPDDRTRVLRAMRDAIAQGAPHDVAFRIVRSDGTLRQLHSRGEIGFDRAGTPIRIFGALLDVTEHKQAEDALRKSEEHLARAVEGSGIGLWDWWPGTQEVVLDTQSLGMLGYTPAELAPITANTWPALTHPDDLPRMREAVSRHLNEETPYFECETRMRHKNGLYVWILTRGRINERDADGKPVRLSGSHMDITARKQAEERIQYLAYYDALTGLPNRTLLHDRATQALTQAQRNGTEVALLFLDLDHFKTINDSLGHSIGDRLLQMVAERLRHLVRASETVSRLGGDEFVLLLTESDAEGATHVASKVIESASQPFVLGERTLNLTASVGISVFPRDEGNFEALLRFADAAMYRAKESGRNTFQFFRPEMNAAAIERLTLEGALRRALERQQFTLYYQPQIELASRRLIGFEALVRWNHPDLGLVSPARFIPVAESCGLIGQIGAWVLQTACYQNQCWVKAGLCRVPMAVNLSPIQILQGNVEEVVRAVLTESGLPADLLDLEVTESLLVDSGESTLAQFTQLKALGVAISVDDFGTGYSNLLYLKRFPIDKLKIDQTFVRDIIDDPDDRAIAGAIVSMSHSLRLRVIAEGVETAEQAELLQSLGCPEAQGYLFARPMPAEDVAAWVRATTTR